MFITPVLILAIEIAGIVGEIQGGNNSVVYFTYALFALCDAAYYIFFFKSETGTNDDEKIVDKREVREEAAKS